MILMTTIPTDTRTGRFLNALASLWSLIGWARLCAAVALVVAVVQEFRRADLAHVALWLGAALGNYTVNKITEMVKGDA